MFYLQSRSGRARIHDGRFSSGFVLIFLKYYWGNTTKVSIDPATLKRTVRQGRRLQLISGDIIGPARLTIAEPAFP